MSNESMIQPLPLTDTGVYPDGWKKSNIAGFDSTSLAENTYFTNHIEWTEHKIMGFKPANRYQIIWQSLIPRISIIIHFMNSMVMSTSPFHFKILQNG